jgi:hypothetical protein
MGRPRKKQIEQAEEDLKEFKDSVTNITMDECSSAPLEEIEPQTKLSKDQIRKSNDVYLKPKRTLYPSANPKTGKQEEFNEKYRESWEYDRQLVKFIAENNEIIGESIDLWTKPYQGVPAEEWDVPVNKPVWGPRYLANQIKRKCYTRFIMEDRPISQDGKGTYFGTMAVESKRQRLDAHRASDEIQISFNKKVSAF